MATASGEVKCVKCEKNGPMITVPTYGGKLGEEVKEKICELCWKEWMDQSIIIINELRLNMSEAAHRQKLTDSMREFLNMPKAES